MKIICQVVENASVSIDNTLFNEIKSGYLLYVGFTHSDTKQTVDSAVNKLASLRINCDANGKINLNGLESGCEILSISQFTLYANSKKGNRPSFTDAMNPAKASELYDYFNQSLSNAGFPTKTGVFGADMNITSTNTGPLTFTLEF